MLSKAHLQCLDRERLGNCLVSRHRRETKFQNSPDILKASDPWMWESDAEPYRVMDGRDRDAYRLRVRKLFLRQEPFTTFLVGDSLTRQWQHAMKCELKHFIGIDPKFVEQRIRYLPMRGYPKGFESHLDLFRNASDKDYLVFNFGHHANKFGKNWPDQYPKILEQALNFDFGSIPDHHIFFRTTTVRHFFSKEGDWNTKFSRFGGIAPAATAQWSWYGGNQPEQPTQNLLALDVFLGGNNNTNHINKNETLARRFGLLDTAPMMLARADASFDGVHFCLPGPMEYWSRMLYHRMEVGLS